MVRGERMNLQIICTCGETCPGCIRFDYVHCCKCDTAENQGEE